jgi:threonine synthase
MCTIFYLYMNIILGCGACIPRFCEDMLEKLNAIAKLIGRTPIMKLGKVDPPNAASVHVKLEYTNPGGSHKDRIAYYMLRGAIKKGLLCMHATC